MLNGQIELTDTSTFNRLEYIDAIWGVLTPRACEKRPFRGRKLEDVEEECFWEHTAE
jgi:hypothetical protein